MPDGGGRAILRFMLAAIGALAALAMPTTHRPPAVPLIVHDPYFSVWSFTDHPADDWPRHWTGKVNGMCGMVRVDGVPYRWLGRSPSDVAKAELVGTLVGATTTEYRFRAGGAEFVVRFVSPVLPGNPVAASRTATLVEVAGAGVEAAYLDLTGELCTDTPGQRVEWTRLLAAGGEVLALGHADARPLDRSGDDHRIDWGRVLLFGQGPGRGFLGGHVAARESFANSGALPKADELRMPRPASDDWPVAAMAQALAPAPGGARAQFVVAYDDGLSIEYFGRKLPPLWRDAGGDAGTLLGIGADAADACARFDSEQRARWEEVGGEGYARLCALAYRQCLGAHKTVRDLDGRLRTFSKENFSNGCIGTVDVMYPASPLFLVYEPGLLESQLLPVLEYAAMERWRWPFAPHDLGTYPLANGQVYGGGERTDENQMPVEECGNMLILLGSLAELHGMDGLAREHWPTLQRWAQYLRQHGLDPGEQLCTDDFAGHLAGNANLSVKAIVGLACFARLAGRLGHKAEQAEYSALAQAWAREWLQKAGGGQETVLAFGQQGTWSQKYNMVWDKLLGLGLFPAEAHAREAKTALRRANRFGTPLDSRADYTKLDWTVWTACLAPTRAERDQVLAPVYRWLDEGPDRVPLSDWYDTKTGKVVGFRARSVVGAVFLPLLMER